MKVYSCICCGKENLFSHSKANKYCDNQCQADYQYLQYIKEWKLGLKNGKKGKLQTSGYIHRYILEKQNFSCSVCSISEYMGKSLTLELDHIDGNASNNAEENLRCLCPNCHSQTPTYRAKNIGNGRKHRKPL